MGIIVTESYVCDFCGDEIKKEEAQVGTLTLRHAGARGMGRRVEVILHDDCAGKVTKLAQPVRRKQRRTATTEAG